MFECRWAMSEMKHGNSFGPADARRGARSARRHAGRPCPAAADAARRRHRCRARGDERGIRDQEPGRADSRRGRCRRRREVQRVLLGQSGVAAVRGHRTPADLVQSITGGTRAESIRAVRLGEALLEGSVEGGAGRGSRRCGWGFSGCRGAGHPRRAAVAPPGARRDARRSPHHGAARGDPARAGRAAAGRCCRRGCRARSVVDRRRAARARGGRHLGRRAQTARSAGARHPRPGRSRRALRAPVRGAVVPHVGRRRRGAPRSDRVRRRDGGLGRRHDRRGAASAPRRTALHDR